MDVICFKIAYNVPVALRGCAYAHNSFSAILQNHLLVGEANSYNFKILSDGKTQFEKLY